jgi:hypothetical protein
MTVSTGIHGSFYGHTRQSTGIRGSLYAHTWQSLCAYLAVSMRILGSLYGHTCSLYGLSRQSLRAPVTVCTPRPGADRTADIHADVLAGSDASNTPIMGFIWLVSVIALVGLSELVRTLGLFRLLDIRISQGAGD